MTITSQDRGCRRPAGRPLAVTVLADNTVAGRGLLAEHGLAYGIVTGTHRLLFDTGQGLVLAANARQLEFDLATVTDIALSHGHYDHTGGLREVLAHATRPTVYAHPDALVRRFHCAPEGCREIGMPREARALLRRAGDRLVLTAAPVAIAPGVYLSGEVRRLHPQEAIEEPFRRDRAGRVADPIGDDQALFFSTAEGTVVLLGCAHAGVINTLETVQGLTGGRPVHTVIGGMHLRSASPARLAWTVSALRRFGVGRLLPTHCTGTAAAAALWHAFPEACQACGVGTRLSFVVSTSRPRHGGRERSVMSSSAPGQAARDNHKE